MRPAKAYVTASGRQQYEAEPERRPAELAPCRRQRLMSPYRGANNLRRSPGGGRPGWRRAVGKGLCHRLEAPTIWWEAREAAGRVGAVQSAKAYVTVSGRQQYEAEPGRRPAELAPCSRQRFMSPFRGANNMRRSPGGGRPSWRRAVGKGLCHRIGAPTI